MPSPDALRLTYSPAWVLASAYLALVSFLLGLVALSFLHPPLFGPVNNATAIWAGLLMVVPLWFVAHQALLLVLRLLLLPFKVPGQFTLDGQGVSLRLGRYTERFAWHEILELRTGEEVLDLDAVHDPQKVGTAGVQALAAVATKDWRLTFVGPEGRSLTVRSNGFRRPLRRAEPRIRAWLEPRVRGGLQSFAEDRVYALEVR